MGFVFWVAGRDWRVVGKVVLTQIYVLEICPLLLCGEQTVEKQRWAREDQLGDFYNSRSKS